MTGRLQFMACLRHIASVLVLCMAQTLSAQAPGDDQSGSTGPSLFENTDTLDARPQLYTTPVDFYHVRIELLDSLNLLSHQYDPARREVLYFATLGNLGSAHRELLFLPVKSKGLDFGHHQYDLYKRRFAEFKFYDSETPITEFDYSQGLQQLDGILQARFGKNFAKGIKLSVDYQRINQYGNFQEQRTKNTILGVGVWYDAPSGIYDGLYHYSSNSIVQQDNGGVINYDTVSALPDPVAVPVNLYGALTTHRERVFSVQNHIHLNRINDSIPRRFLIDVIHTGQYRNGLIKFYDEDVSESLDYYGDFLVDARGARQYMSFHSFDNRADIQFRVQPPEAPENDISQHLLRLGIQYRYTKLEQEPITRKMHEVFLNASTRITFTKHMDVRGAGYLQLTGQAGDFSLDGALRYRFEKFGRIDAQVSLYQRSPNVMESALYVTQTPIWTTDFKKPVYTRMGLLANFEKIRMYAYGGLQVIGNHVYYGEDRMPVQMTEAQDVWQLVVAKEVSLGALGLQATAAFQEAPDVLRVPKWIGQVQIYYTDFWFKGNMQVRTGVDLRITDTFDGASYFPLTGQFHLSPVQIEQYPALDVFFDMQVKQAFRAFFKLENVSSWFVDDIYANVVYYPQFDQYFRFGIWMKLFN